MLSASQVCGFCGPLLLGLDVIMGMMGVRLRQCRQVLGRTQSDVAEAAGVSKAAVSKWESDGSGATSAIVALKIARYLNVNPYWLVFGEGQPTDRLQCRDLSESAHELAHRFDLLPQEAREALTALVFAFDAREAGKVRRIRPSNRPASRIDSKRPPSAR